MRYPIDIVFLPFFLAHHYVRTLIATFLHVHCFYRKKRVYQRDSWFLQAECETIPKRGLYTLLALPQPHSIQATGAAGPDLALGHITCTICQAGYNC